MSLSKIVAYTDKFLRISEIGDWDNALNGLQIENSGRVTKIGAAVDASTRTLSGAAKQDVDLLIVHHGLFWAGLKPVRGILRRQLQIAFENDIALYSAHLPLDLHPQVGNNAQLARALGLRSTTPFFEEKGQLIGLKARAAMSRVVCSARTGSYASMKRSPSEFHSVPPITNVAGWIGMRLFSNGTMQRYG